MCIRTSTHPQQANTTLKGTGIKIGVLSDSVNCANANTGNSQDLNQLLAQGVINNTGKQNKQGSG